MSGRLPPEIYETEVKQKFYIYSDVTHTHTRPEPGQPWKARGREKADTNDGQKAKTAQRGGREQTDLQNQPTRRKGPHQHRART